jgi:Phage integrase, N-terminal SAM-like domain
VKQHDPELVNLLAEAVGAYSSRTISGYINDLTVFSMWCQTRGQPWLPAEPGAVSEFVDNQSEQHRLSTIKRRLCAIAFAHRMRDLSVPTESKIVRLAVRRAAHRRPNRPKQVCGLTNTIRARIVSGRTSTLPELRDAALISVGYDTLCRSSGSLTRTKTSGPGSTRTGRSSASLAPHRDRIGPQRAIEREQAKPIENMMRTVRRVCRNVKRWAAPPGRCAGPPPA